MALLIVHKMPFGDVLWLMPENTHCRGKYHCMGSLQFYLLGFNCLAKCIFFPVAKIKSL